MSREFRASAYVLAQVKYGRGHRLLRLLTKDHGLLLAQASFAANLRSPLHSLSRQFVFAQYNFSYYQDKLQIDSGEVIYGFDELSQDLKTVTAISHLAEVYIDALSDHEALDQAFLLWSYTAARLLKSPDAELDLAIATLRFLAEIGFRPNLDCCVACASRPSYPAFFSLLDSSVLCTSSLCQAQYESSYLIPLAQELALCLQDILDRPIPAIFAVKLNRNLRALVLNFVQNYLEFTMEKEYKSLSFFQELINFEASL